MIRSFKSEEAQKIFDQIGSRKLPQDIQASALRKLNLLDGAIAFAVLAVVPGNRLEKLSGDREGQYSIRINEQWRICFVWTEDNNAEEVEIVDYH